MIYLYNSDEDLAIRGHGVLAQGTGNRWYTDDPSNEEELDALFETNTSDGDADDYRDERDDSSRLADRHGC